MRRPARAFTEDELRVAEQLLDDGVSYKEIARTLDRHASTILRRFPHRSAWSNTSGPEARRLHQMLTAIPTLGKQ